MSFNPHEACPIEALPVVKDVEGKPMLVLCVWSISRAYGGPEEGGWWYDTGELEHIEFHTIRQIADLRMKELREKYPYTGKSGSVLGGEDWAVGCNENGKIPHPYYPLVIPHYE